MFNFKNFFKKNYDTQFIIEANRGETPESSVLLDEEDLDFLYQTDYKYWGAALASRYDVLLDELKNRDKVRKEVESKCVKEFLSSYRDKESRENISLDSFVSFIKNFASKFDDYGQEIETPIEKKIKFKSWEKNFIDEYEQDFDRVKRKGSRDFFHELRFMIFNYIVPFVLEKKAYKIQGSKPEIYIKFYINRLIQKLETTKGEKITLPGNSYALKNLSKALMSEIPVEMKDSGSYGFDLNRARVQNIPLGADRSTVLGKTSGFTFPNARGPSGLQDMVRELIKFNYQRHMGDLPSDENFKKYAGNNEDGSPILTYKYTGARKNIEDNFNYDFIKNEIRNNIWSFIANNRYLSSWSEVKENGLYDIINIKFQNEIEFGNWAKSSESITRFILNNRSKAEDSLIDKDSSPSQVAADYVSSWQKISGSRPIIEKFADYFAEKQVQYMLESGLSSPRILDGDTPEEIKQNYSRLEPEVRREIEKSLSSEDLESFKRTGRLPLSLKTVSGKKKLTPGSMDHSPVILPFLKMKTTDMEGNTKDISVPLVKPGKYLVGLSLKNVTAVPDNDEVDDVDGEAEGDSEDFDNSGKITTTPSTSDRTSVYKIRDENGEEKEVKVIDAQSADRYIKKKGVGGVYYSIDTKGQSRKYSFSRWKRSDKIKFFKVWSHPEYSGQKFSSSDVRTKYKQLFGKDLLDMYDDIDPYDFYTKEKTPDNYPFVLSGYRIGKVDEVPRRKESDETTPDASTAASSVSRNLSLTILPSMGSPEIIGFPLVINAIKNCINPPFPRVCNNDGNVGFRNWILESPQRIQEIHDYLVKQVLFGSGRGGNPGIWKTFIGEGGTKKSAKMTFCQIFGKWVQSEGQNKWKSDTPQHGQVGRKARKNLIGASSIQAFMSDFSKYEEYIDGLQKKQSQSNSSSKRILQSILSVDILDDDDDDKIAEWFYPGYKDSEDGGKYQSDKNNFKPELDEWKYGPPTDLRSLLTLFYESDKKITKDQKEILLNKIKQEKEFLVGDGSTEKGVIGLNSYIFNKNIFDETPEDSNLTVKQLIESLHRYTAKVYDKDIELVSSIKEYSNEEKVENDINLDEQDEYLRIFKQKFTILQPNINKLILSVIDINNTKDSILSNTVEKFYNLVGKSQTSNENFVKIISSIYYILGNNNNSLIKTFNLYIKDIVKGGTTDAEVEYIREKQGRNTRSFYLALETVSNLLFSIGEEFEKIINNLIVDMENDEDYRKTAGSFFKQLYLNKFISDEIRTFLISNLYKSGGLKAPEGVKMPTYFNFMNEVDEIRANVLKLTRTSSLRRADVARLSSNPEFLDIGKISRVEILHLIKSKQSEQEKSSIAKRVKDYYISRGSWNNLDSYFKSVIDSNIK